MPDIDVQPEAPTVTIRTTQEYRRARERIDQLERIQPSAVSNLELNALRAAMRAYEPRQTKPGAPWIRVNDLTRDRDCS